MLFDKYREVEDCIVAEVEAGLKEGYKLSPLRMRGPDNSCCALGMVMRHDAPCNERHAAARLGISYYDVMAIARGFDLQLTSRAGNEELDQNWFDVGARIAIRYNRGF